MSYDLVERDTGSVLTLTCKDTAGAAINLTGYTVNYHWRCAGQTRRSAQVTISDAPNGVTTYTFGRDDLRAGQMELEVEIISAAGLVTTTRDALAYQVRARIGT